MDAIAATRPTLAALRHRLADLKDERYAIEMSSGRAWISGAMTRLSNEIAEVRDEIARREAELVTG